MSAADDEMGGGHHNRWKVGRFKVVPYTEVFGSYEEDMGHIFVNPLHVVAISPHSSASSQLHTLLGDAFVAGSPQQIAKAFGWITEETP